MVGVAVPRSPPATMALCSAFWRARSTAWSLIPRPTRTSSTRCWPMPTRWCGHPVRQWPSMFAPAEIHRAHPHLTVTAITPFGLDGPWKDRPATEFTLQAWSGGIVGLGRGSADRAPVFVGGQVGDYLAGAYAAAATIASRMRGAAELIDLSMLETQILGLTYYPVSYFEMLGQAVAGRPSAHGAGYRAGQGRADRHRLRDGTAVVRPVRDDRTSGLDRRGVASVDHRAGQREGR